MVAHALEACGGYSLRDVVLVVQNNHHHRIAPFEARLPFAVGAQHYPPEYLDSENLLPEVGAQPTQENIHISTHT